MAQVADSSSADIKAALTQGTQVITAKFCNQYAKFVATLAKVFPECPKLARAKQEADDLAIAPGEVQEGAVRQWDAAMRRMWEGANYYHHVKQRHEAMLSRGCDLPFVADMDLWPKWHDPYFNADSKQYLWQYLDQLNKQARFYCIVPKGLMDRVMTLMERYINVDEEGHFQLASDANFHSVLADVMATLGHEDVVSQTQLSDVAGTAMDLLEDFLGPNRERLPGLLANSGVAVNPTIVSALLDQGTALLQASDNPATAAPSPLQLLNNLPPELMTQLLATMLPPQQPQ